MISVFRLFSPWRKPWDATGAIINGGRWNSPGRAVLYAASSLSLACLEILVHIRNPNNFPEYSFSKLSLDEKEIDKWGEGTLRTRAVIESEILSRDVGDEWIGGRKWPQRLLARLELPVKQVPSIVIPQEWNYLIDPDMPNLAERWSAPEPFQIDPRLLNPSLR